MPRPKIDSTKPLLLDSKSTTNKSEEILAAAEEIMSQKGMAETSISEIARKAGVVDSVIYHFFKNKEDLLFSIPGRRLIDVLKLLEEHLQGITDPFSRLGKMVWFHLHYNYTHQWYARLLLFECRSSKGFYSSPAYQLIRKYSRILQNILDEGRQSGAFRTDVGKWLMRDVILGALDMETIGFLTDDESQNDPPDFESLFDLCQAMVAPRPAAVPARGRRADAIINAAIEMFAVKGFAKTKISDIAKKANLADATIYEYFAGKEDLLFSIAAQRIPQYLKAASDAFEIRSPVRRLRRLIKYHFSSFLAERNFLKVFLLEMQLNARFYSSKAFSEYRKYYAFIEELVEQGQKAGFFRERVKPSMLRKMFLGAFNHLALRWLILEDDAETDKMEEIDQVTELLLSAVMETGYSTQGENLDS
jgi:TetR/AcrR family fatty acid metabolism transcriptional regulator